MSSEQSPGAVTVAAAVLAAITQRPGTCVRHGEPVVDGVDVALRSRRPSQGGRAPMHEWPFCATCIRWRARMRRVAAALLTGGIAIALAALAWSAVYPGTEPGLLAPLVVGFAAVVASGFVFARSRWRRIADARVSDDGEWVTFGRPHPAFTSDMYRLLAC